jgi:uncharacterized membrane protein
MINHLKKEKYAALATLLRQWALTWGILSIVVIFDPFVHGLWTAAICLVLGFILDRRSLHRFGRRPPCLRMMTFGGYALIFSAFIMVTIIMLHKLDLMELLVDESHGAPVNASIPYIASLIIYPAMAGTMIGALYRFGKHNFCAQCPISHCDVSCARFTLGLVHQEERYQIVISLILSLTLTAVTWAYYFIGYININFNMPDMIFFMVIPVAFTIIATIDLVNRYRVIHTRVNTSTPDFVIRTNTSTLRFLVIKEDRILLDTSIFNPIEKDTPAMVNINYDATLTDEEACREFAKISGIEPSYIKRLYVSPGPVDRSNTYHFGVVLDDVDGLKLSGQWTALDTIDRLWREGLLTMSLIGEIHRVYMVTMAWKTYDINGKRLYPIKNYHPTFKLSNFRDWDVDYSDTTWLKVAENNEDRRLWSVRRFIRKILGSDKHHMLWSLLGIIELLG